MQSSAFAWFSWSKLPARLLTWFLSLMLGLAIATLADAAMAALQQGDSGAEVRALQTQLVAAKCYSGPITGYFGPLTHGAVETCQQRYNLQVDGIVGPKTLAALNGKPSTTSQPQPQASSSSQSLQRGSMGDRVITLQTQLQQLGLYNGPIDGDFGRMTEKAVAELQQRNGLTGTGVFSDREQQLIATTPAAKPSTQSADLAGAIGRSQLTIGDAGQDVQTLQAKLKNLRYFDSAATGYYGELTRLAVTKFQDDRQLPSNGIADNATIKALGLTSTTQASQRLSPKATASRPVEAQPSRTLNGSSPMPVAKAENPVAKAENPVAKAENPVAKAENRVAVKPANVASPNNSAFNQSSFTGGGGTPIGQQPIPASAFGNAQINQGGRFVVVIPKQSDRQFADIKKLVPDASEGRSSIGPYIQAGAFPSQAAADQQTQFLKAYGLDARVAYR
jgi:peptidoglycan hydrolase-like protein with peptidoglycan-binding domain